MCKREAPLERLAAAFYKLDNSASQVPASFRRESEKDNAPGRPSVRIDQPSKVLILGQKDTVLTDRQGENRWVLKAG